MNKFQTCNEYHQAASFCELWNYKIPVKKQKVDFRSECILKYSAWNMALMDIQHALLYNTNITSTIPLQVGMRKDHITLSRHVIEALPSSAIMPSRNPGLHSYGITDPMMNSSPVLVPFGKCPGSPQVPPRNRKRKYIGNRQFSEITVGNI